MKQAIDGSWMTWFIVATALVLAGAAGASDGVIEINQACATATGCIEGDSAGFPVVIGGSGSPRSYILTSDLTPTNSGSAMLINGDNVTLDMNGFRILCSPSSTFGIRFFPPQKNLRVSNGKIVGCHRGGIGHGFAKGGDGAHIDRVTVNWANVTATESSGIYVGDNSIVESSTVIHTGSAFPVPEAGIQLGLNSIARNNVASGTKAGIVGGAGCLFTGNVVRENRFGLIGFSSTFINNTSVGDERGIFAGSGSNVIGNTLRDNIVGLELSTDTTYRGNAITGSTSQTIDAGEGQNRGGNTCLGAGIVDTSCF